MSAAPSPARFPPPPSAEAVSPYPAPPPGHAPVPPPPPPPAASHAPNLGYNIVTPPEQPLGAVSAGPEPTRDELAEAAIEETLGFVEREYVRQGEDSAAMQGTVDDQDMQRGDVEFLPGPCVHDMIVFPLFALCFVTLIPLLEYNLLLLSLAGAAATYAADFLNFRQGALIVMNVSLGVVFGTLYVSHLFDFWNRPHVMFPVLSAFAAAALLSAYASLHFHWVQRRFPELAAMLERLVLACLPVAALAPLYGITAAFVGGRNAPFAYTFVLVALYCAFYTRKASSFIVVVGGTTPARAMELQCVTRPIEAVAFAAITVFTPAWAYICTQWVSLDMTVFTWLNILGLQFLPILCLLVAPRQTLWWLKLAQYVRRDGTPTSVLAFVLRRRALLLFIAYTAVLHCVVERVLRSRYGYLFVGIVPPLNYIVLLVVGYAFTLIIVLARRLYTSPDSVSADNEPLKNKRAMAEWSAVLLLTMGASVGVAIAAGMPPFFHPLSALTAACFVVFILDRRATGHFFAFLFFSSLLLLWWMWHTFSFIAMDLHVIGEAFAVSTQAVAGTIFGAYVIGAIAFVVALNNRRRGALPLVLLFHASKVGWVEHVLYSQAEPGAYHPLLVFLTTAVGVAMAWRLYKNEVLELNWAAVVIGFYLSTVVTYGAEAATPVGATSIQRSLELAVTQIFGLAVCGCIALLELEKDAGKKREDRTLQGIAACMTGFLCVFGIRGTIFTAVAESAGIPDPSIVQVVAITLLSTAAATWLIYKRYTDHTTAHTAAGMVAVFSVVLLAVDPSVEEVLVGSVRTVDDMPFFVPLWSRWAGVLAAALAILGTRLPEVPMPLRTAFWISVGCLASFAATPMAIPMADFNIYAAVMVYFAVTVALVMACHYANFERDIALILYVVSLGAMAVTFVLINFVDVWGVTTAEAYVYEAIGLSRTGVVVLAASVNGGVAAVLKLRLNDLPLLRPAVPLTAEMAQQVAMIVNYATVICFAALASATRWVDGSTAAMYVFQAPVLLLLHDDGAIFTSLAGTPFRYFPPFVAAVGVLTGLAFYDAALVLGTVYQWRAVTTVLSFVALLPSLYSNVTMLYSLRAPKTTVARVVALLALDVAMMALSSSRYLRWVAVTCAVCHFGRLVLHSKTMKSLQEVLLHL